MEFFDSKPEDELDRLIKIVPQASINSDTISPPSLPPQPLTATQTNMFSFSTAAAPTAATQTDMHSFSTAEVAAATRDMMFRIAAMQPVINIDPKSVKPPPKRRNVKISSDPQSVAARHRRERISEKIRILQSMVPGGSKMDTAEMLDEAIHFVEFLKTQIQSLETTGLASPPPLGLHFPVMPNSFGERN